MVEASLLSSLWLTQWLLTDNCSSQGGATFSDELKDQLGLKQVVQNRNSEDDLGTIR